MKRYCLVRVYGDDEIYWMDIPTDVPVPIIGDESHQHECLATVEGGVVIAIVNEESKAGKIIAFIDYLDAINETEPGAFSFRSKLVALLTLAAQGSDATRSQRDVVKQHFSSSAS